jgi:hypothetical protein
VAVAAIALLLAATPVQPSSAASQRGRSTPDQDVVAEFSKRVSDYIKLQKKLEREVTPVSNDSTALEIDKNQRELRSRLVAARASAKPGDVFHPTMQAHVRKVLVIVFSEPEGKRLRSTILDENPVGTPVRVNGAYPDGIPLSSMPLQILDKLPQLPETLEYRFVGERLILLDNHAHLIVDYVDRALPRV